MNIRFNQDGSVGNIEVNQFVNQLSSGQKIGVLVTGLAADEFTARAYGVLPNGDSTIISCVPVDGSTYWEITLNTANTAYAGKLTITVQIILNQTNYVFTYPLYLTVNPTIPGNVEFPITLDEVTTFLSQLENYTTKAAADAKFQRKYDINTLRVYNSLARAEEDSNILANQYILVRTAPGEFSIYVKNTNSTFTKISIDEAAKALKDSDGNIITNFYLPRINFTTFQNDLEEGHIIVGNAEKASKKTGTNDELATEHYVDTAVGQLTAHYLTHDIYGNNFPTKAALLEGPYYYGIDIHTPDENDYAFVQADETHEGKSSRYAYINNGWQYQYSISADSAGGVQDVKVNGESVVDEHNVANIEIDLDSKVDKADWPDNADRVYGVTEAGNQAIFKVGDGLLSNLIVRRNADAQILVPAVPTNEYHSTSKSYVDSHSIKEISTQDINLWELEVGIYKLTYNGDKYLHYNGAYPTTKVAIGGNNEKLLYISKSWVGSVMWECADDIGNTRYGYSASNNGAYYQAYMYSPVNKINGSQNQITSGIYAPTVNGQPGTVLIAKENEAPGWEYISPYARIYTIDLASSNTITIDLRSDFPMFNGRDDILVEIMPQDMLDEWVENNVTFEETHPGYFYGITFTADSTLSAPVKVLVKCQVKGTI